MTQQKTTLSQCGVRKRAILYARTSSDDTTKDSLSGQLEVCESEAKWVRKIFEWYVIEDLSLCQVRARLQELCVPKPSIAKPKQGTGKRGTFDWSHTTVRDILMRRAYIGEWEYSKNTSQKRRILERSIIADDIARRPVTVEVPAIVERALFDLAQDKLEHNRKKTQRTAKHPFLMRGKASCGVCDYGVRTVSKTWRGYTYHYYACNRKWNVTAVQLANGERGNPRG